MHPPARIWRDDKVGVRGTTRHRSTLHIDMRPGVEAAARLLSLSPPSAHLESWDLAASYYKEMLAAKECGTRLIALEKRREDLKLVEQMSLTKEQLVDVIVEWKFLIGKPRNALRPILRSNSDAAVISASQRAFATLDGIPKTNGIAAICDIDNCSSYYNGEIIKAVNHLCELRGVGPATASAILCLHRPDIFVFMADEVIECLYEGKRGYTNKIYMQINDRCRDIASQLNIARQKMGNGTTDPVIVWTPCIVGEALWTVAILSATNCESGLSSIFDHDTKNKDDSLRSRKRTKKC